MRLGHRPIKNNKRWCLYSFDNHSRKIGKVAAMNIMGKKEEFFGTLGSFGLRFHNMEFFKTGMTSDLETKRQNIKIITSIIQTSDAANYSGVS
ncbi:hypothetical protein [Candidatus Mycoplasma mahonii]|uniref:hypothetical protein n=1 Tax=Candidatus Mycoplasma mahonii TaxID=3004105 RepID=UPI0026EB6202|nr:hypothetical protein [Candidatus Mycoplasma mahonii]WKX02743.1 hypothetical protein O3I44_01575 [Candidatus Mycoplasma mahonii]